MTAVSNNMEKNRAQRKVRTGLVVSNKMDKTVVVAVEQKTRHKMYHKIIKQTRKIVAHDEANECQTGDFVQIMETRPLSKTKHWRIVSVLEKAD